MKKLLLSGTFLTLAAPIATISCGIQNNNDKSTGVFTEYVRAHDLALSLGVVPQWHARSDLGSTHDLTNEGYLNEFSKDTLNGKRYNGADREYFSSLGIKLFISREIDDTKGKLQDVSNKYSVLNSETASWQDELKKIAAKFNKEWPNSKNYLTKANDVIDKFEIRNQELQTAISSKFTSPKTIILVRGDDDSTKVFSGVIPEAHIEHLYLSSMLNFPSSTDDTKLNKKPYLIAGRSTTTPNNDLVEAFKNTADYLIYLQTPKSNLSQNDIENNSELKQMIKTGGKIVAAKYDYWYLPYRGAAIGANLSIDNIYKDILNEKFEFDWKSNF